MASVLTRAIGRRGDKDVILVDKDGNVVERPSRAEKKADLDQELDRVTTGARLTGPGARAARTRAEPRRDVATLGRERRR